METDAQYMIAQHIPGIESQWEKYGPLFRKEELPAKRILLKRGDIAGRMYFIYQGCIRLYYIDEDKDATLQFFFDRSCICSMESFLERKASEFSLETLEKGIYYSISRDNYLRLLAELPEFKIYFGRFIQTRMFHYMLALLDHIRYSPEKRYKALIKQYPYILSRVHHYYIASYLGITPVSFSRIKNRK
jgi:CRP-like cAMP-binding protein